VADRTGARAWSAELLSPMRDETKGFPGRLGTVSRPRFVLALDVRRGGWSVRVNEASMKKATSTSAATFYEHRIEVAASGLPTMKISRGVYSSTSSPGRPPGSGHLSARDREVPVTVAAEGGQWHRVALPPGPFDAQFAVFTSDPAAAARALGPEAVEHLLARVGAAPRAISVADRPRTRPPRS
jgi:hypothetical protein